MGLRVWQTYTIRAIYSSQTVRYYLNIIIFFLCFLFQEKKIQNKKKSWLFKTFHDLPENDTFSLTLQTVWTLLCVNLQPQKSQNREVFDFGKIRRIKVRRNWKINYQISGVWEVELARKNKFIMWYWEISGEILSHQENFYL